MPNDQPTLWRARSEVSHKPKPRGCDLEAIGGCGRELDWHHRDENPSNNSDENLMVVCRTHHKLIHSGALDLTDPVMPEFYVQANGQRRYRHTLEKQIHAKRRQRQEARV